MFFQPIPDVTPYLSKGTLGALVFIVTVGMIIGGYVAIKVVKKLTQKGNGASTGGNGIRQAESLREAQIQRDAAQKQLDELKAGSQPVDFWVRKYDESAAKANQPVLRNQEIMINLLREVLESQRRIRN